MDTMSYIVNQPLALAASGLYLFPTVAHSILMFQKRSFYVSRSDSTSFNSEGGL